MALENQTRIAVPITSMGWTEALDAVKRASASEADLIEIRLDYVIDRNLTIQAEEMVREAKSIATKPLIFTHRSGKPEVVPNRGAQNISRLLSARQKPFAEDFFDFDLRADFTTTLHFYKAYLRLFSAHPQIILSHHNFTECDEEEIFNTYNRLATLQPDVIKIAVQAKRIDNLLSIFKLLETANKESVKTIAIAMGEIGNISRILGPSRGSFLTFASLERGSESAPGQLSLAEMISLYRVREIDEDTAIYGLLGYPVGHSVSPHMHNAAFAALGINAVYLPIAISPEDLAPFIENFAKPKRSRLRWKFRGASVTVPHKINVAPLLDEVDRSATQVGAVNTIALNGAQLFGYNTDVAGALAPLKLIDLNGANVVVLGSGGAARAVIAGLTDEGARVTVYGRDETKLAQLAERFNVLVSRLDKIDEQLNCDLLINTTPIGMAGWQSSETIPISRELLKNCRIVYDLVYNPIETHLLEAARLAGAQTLSGLDMLIAQAAEQFRLWTGQQAPIEVMRAAAMAKLNQAK